MNQAATLGRARQGDDEAFATLVQAQSRRVFQLAFRRMRNEQDAEDVEGIERLHAGAVEVSACGVARCRGAGPLASRREPDGAHAEHGNRASRG